MDSRTRAQEWQRLAEMDLSSAEYLLKMHPVPVEIICYHCQQSAEKYLKGYLVLHGINPPKIHDLDELCKLCMKWSDTFKDIADQCSDLTAYGVQPRYPMEMMLEEQDMWQALNSAKTIRDFILTLAPEMVPEEHGQDESQSQDSPSL
ncbi:HEPN domain-containing protein [Thermanaerosceptrum fracticalcis]|uniref:HEPN domain-containing protein n=1 Tax=Thermanaerosceptrum fracticalcis TaxID=1712410 RepID=A0A7G6E6N0_THEFR|nr:HEPN domain-containing protein [Thermanaerosceptrum fracticalcis]QNB47734.1 HEPN domain-containing protein [Thermanaerosceptrum fracticalcis]